MVATATMAADVLAHLPPRKRLKATAQIPSTSRSDLPPPVSLLALGAQRLKHAQEKDMITDDHGRPAGPKMNPMSPTTLMRVAGSFDNDATVPTRIRESPGTVAADAKAKALAKGERAVAARQLANEKARAAKDAARVAEELADLAREAKKKAEALLGSRKMGITQVLQNAAGFHARDIGIHPRVGPWKERVPPMGRLPPGLRPRAHRPDPVRPPDPLSTTRPGTLPDRDHSGDTPMSKGKSQSNREAKKPKKEKPKVLATANSNSGKNATVIAGKAVK